jgi:mono/diheme cytochrome c family protein
MQQQFFRTRKSIARSAALGASILVVCSCFAAAEAKPINYQLPDETAAFKPGPGVEVAQNNCTACHSADYILTQPRNAGAKRDFWQTEVTKMIKVFGAPIDDGDASKIVDYLTATY